MSFIRIFRWTCDVCQAQEEVEPFGGPKGWMWRSSPAGVRNFCKPCAHLILTWGGWERSQDDPKQIIKK